MEQTDEQPAERDEIAALAMDMGAAITRDGWKVERSGVVLDNQLAAEALLGYLLEEPIALARALRQRGHELVLVQELSRSLDDWTWRTIRKQG